MKKTKTPTRTPRDESKKREKKPPLIPPKIMAILSKEEQLTLWDSGKRETLLTYIQTHTLHNEVLKKILMSNNGPFFEAYIVYHKVSVEIQQLLIHGHHLRLIKLYIEKHAFDQAAQFSFLEFMEERLYR